MEEQLYNCLGCGHVGPETGEQDECPACGERFGPDESPDGNCPGCGCSYPRSTCPKCGAGDDFGTIETMLGTGGWVNKKEYRASIQAAKAILTNGTGH